MVDIRRLGYEDEEELLAMRKEREKVVHLRRQPAEQELNAFDRQMLNPTARLTLPLNHSRQLRRIADQLRALAGKLEVISTNDRDRERSLLFEAWMEIRMADKRIKNIGNGKTPDGQEY